MGVVSFVAGALLASPAGVDESKSGTELAGGSLLLFVISCDAGGTIGAGAGRDALLTISPLCGVADCSEPRVGLLVSGSGDSNGFGATLGATAGVSLPAGFIPRPLKSSCEI